MRLAACDQLSCSVRECAWDAATATYIERMCFEVCFVQQTCAFLYHAAAPLHLWRCSAAACSRLTSFADATILICLPFPCILRIYLSAHCRWLVAHDYHAKQQTALCNKCYQHPHSFLTEKPAKTCYVTKEQAQKQPAHQHGRKQPAI